MVSTKLKHRDLLDRLLHFMVAANQVAPAQTNALRKWEKKFDLLVPLAPDKSVL